MLKIVLLGCGAMGKAVEEAVKDNGDMEIAAKCDKYADGCYRSLDEIKESFDMVIDFSKPESLESTINYCIAHKKPVLIGTTGFTGKQEEKIKKTAREIPVFRSRNMSVGINLIEKILKLISPALKNDFDVEIIEAHHNKKTDCPSGTAKMLLEAVINGENHIKYGRYGHSPRAKGEIGIHSVRCGTVAGEHTVIFAGSDEIIEIKHTALSKRIFAEGALRAARFLKDAGPGLYGMDDII